MKNEEDAFLTWLREYRTMFINMKLDFSDQEYRRLKAAEIRGAINALDEVVTYFDQIQKVKV